MYMHFDRQLTMYNQATQNERVGFSVAELTTTSLPFTTTMVFLSSVVGATLISSCMGGILFKYWPKYLNSESREVRSCDALQVQL